MNSTYFNYLFGSEDCLYVQLKISCADLVATPNWSKLSAGPDMRKVKKFPRASFLYQYISAQTAISKYQLKHKFPSFKPKY